MNNQQLERNVDMKWMEAVNMNNEQWTEATGMLSPPILTVAHQFTFYWWAETAENIWVTALEGGSTYWMDYVHTYGKDLKDGKQILQNFRIRVEHGSDGWGDDSEVAYGTSLNVITKGIHMLPSSYIVTSVMRGDIDAEIADQIIQYGLFGELVYG